MKSSKVLRVIICVLLFTVISACDDGDDSEPTASEFKINFDLTEFTSQKAAWEELNIQNYSFVQEYLYVPGDPIKCTVENGECVSVEYLEDYHGNGVYEDSIDGIFQKIYDTYLEWKDYDEGVYDFVTIDVEYGEKHNPVNIFIQMDTDEMSMVGAWSEIEFRDLVVIEK